MKSFVVFAFNPQVFHGEEKSRILSSIFPIILFLSLNILQEIYSGSFLTKLEFFLLYLFTWNRSCHMECIRVLQKNMYFSCPCFLYKWNVTVIIPQLSL